jgi:hypothetical protein
MILILAALISMSQNTPYGSRIRNNIYIVKGTDTLWIQQNDTVQFFGSNKLTKINDTLFLAGLDLGVVTGTLPDTNVLVSDETGRVSYLPTTEGLLVDVDTFTFPRLNADTVEIDSALILNGTFYTPPTVVNAATYNVLVTDYIINVTYTPTGTVAIAIPAALNVDGRHLYFKDAGGNAAANNITITPASGTIDGQPSLIINGNYEGGSIYTDGSNWFVKHLTP